MELTKFTHACVRLESDGRSLLLDPGVWTEDAALTGATDVLVTHEHFDHLDTDRLARAQTANPALTIYAPAPVVAILAAAGVSAQTVGPDEEFEAAGFAVRTVGGRHADIYDGLPGCANIGYVIDGSVYHPGDSLFVPDARVETLLVPISAPWLKLAETIDFLRAVRPARAFAIHDAMLNDKGFAVTQNWLGMKGETDYARLPEGTSVDL